MIRKISLRVLCVTGFAAGACVGEREGTNAELAGLSGAVQIDGSSTVYPITEAVAEEFGREAGGSVRVTVGLSGTGGGFKRFCAGETDISNASRGIKQSERDACASAGIEPIEVPVAYDGLAVVANQENEFVDCLTTEELKRIWEPGSTVRTWAQVRQGWPNRPLRLYGPGTDSGTFDYFTEAIVGEEDASRADYTASEDDNVLAQGITGDENALGYFGIAYYQESAGLLKLVPVDGGAGCVAPSVETVKNGTYKPLSRPLFIYVSSKSLERPEVAAFVRYYLQNAGELAGDVGYVPLEDAAYQRGLQQLSAGDTPR